MPHHRGLAPPLRSTQNPRSRDHRTLTFRRSKQVLPFPRRTISTIAHLRRRDSPSLTITCTAELQRVRMSLALFCSFTKPTGVRPHITSAGTAPTSRSQRAITCREAKTVRCRSTWHPRPDRCRFQWFRRRRGRLSVPGRPTGRGPFRIRGCGHDYPQRAGKGLSPCVSCGAAPDAKRAETDCPRVFVSVPVAIRLDEFLRGTRKGESGDWTRYRLLPDLVEVAFHYGRRDPRSW